MKDKSRKNKVCTISAAVQYNSAVFPYNSVNNNGNNSGTNNNTSTSSSPSSSSSTSSPSLNIFILFLLFTFGIQLTGACPSDCNCKWKGGKQTVECVKSGFRTFPGPIDSGTQVLDLSGNSFETLPSDHFMRLSLINLQKIYLSKCKLSHINTRAFRGLSNLVDLDLSQNALREVPTSTFPDCQGLMRLILSGNPISQLQRNAFMHLESLTTLEMNHCAIENIEKGAFEGLISLEWLKLNGNKLKRLQGLEALPLALKGVWLEENPWECDCKLLELRLWLEERKVANSIEPRCATPFRLTNHTLSSLSLDHFACIPQVSPTTMYQKIGEGKNVSLLCKVTSTPESSVEWWFNGQPVSNSSLNMLIETTSSVPTTTNNIFSSSSSSSSSSFISSSSSSLASFIPIVGGIGGATEKKSELLILNATAEENGTFLCIAKNPGGMASANFTIRVLSSLESDINPESATSLVGSYPNIFLIIVSTAAVIGVVIIIFVATLIICKCSRLCRGVGGRHGSQDSRLRTRKSGVGGSNSECSVNESRNKDGKEHGGNKLDRHLSDTSTLTAHTKSNGSVFLLSTSSELGDSNPDIIEGVKRVEADGHETSCFSNGNAYTQSEIGMMSLGVPFQQQHHSNPNVIVNPSTGEQQNLYSAYPQDYGLPTNLNVSTLVRRSPSYQLSPNCSMLSNHINPQFHTTIPPTYDLAKYPKEYINPSPTTYMTYGPQPPGTVVYTTHHEPPPSSSVQNNHHAQASYPYIITPPGTYVYHSGPGPDDYVMSSMGMEMPLNITMDHLGGTYVEIPNQASAPITCSCAPIEEVDETGVDVNSVTVSVRDKSTSTSNSLIQQQQQPPKHSSNLHQGINNAVHENNKTTTTNNVSTSTTMNSNVYNNSSRGISSGTNSGASPSINSAVGATSSGSPSTSGTSSSSKNSINGSGINGSGGGSTKNETVKARLQRQFTTQINESPDEGYEDESAEGTEI